MESKQEMKWNVFISYASEDKSFAQSLANAIAKRGLRVWFDDFELHVGDSLRRSIDKGLSNSSFGIVILSPHFFAKEWPQKELNAFIARESKGDKIVLPIWHNISADQIREFSPILADRIAISSDIGLKQIVEKLLLAINSVSKPGETVYIRSQHGYIGVMVRIMNEYEHEAKRLMVSINENVTRKELLGALSQELPELLPERSDISYDVLIDPVPNENEPFAGKLLREGVTIIVRPKRIIKYDN